MAIGAGHIGVRSHMVSSEFGRHDVAGCATEHGCVHVGYTTIGSCPYNDEVQACRDHHEIDTTPEHGIVNADFGEE